MNFDTPLKLSDIHIRDPFVLLEDDIYYMYGTRGANFGKKTKGFDVYKSRDLIHWSEAKPVFFSEKYQMNTDVNWAPEVHRYNGKYYMCATFSFGDCDRRGTYILVSDSPDSEFVPHSNGSITPHEWFALDGTLYFEDGIPYMIFCHEHVQILNGTVEYVRLSDDLKNAAEAPKTLFHGSDAFGVEEVAGRRYVTDGPFLCRINEKLYMIWSTSDQGNYMQCVAVSDNGKLSGKWIQQPHLFDRNGGHGMLFETKDRELTLVLHRPNERTYERPMFIRVMTNGEHLVLQ